MVTIVFIGENLDGIPLTPKPLSRVGERGSRL
jgi:hypothetical protein